jgi:hypothetical protein
MQRRQERKELAKLLESSSLNNQQELQRKQRGIDNEI